MRPQVAEGEEFSFKPVDHMIEHNEWICPIKPIHGDNAYYSISKKEIVIPEKSQFKDGESFYSNLFHEMAHSTGAEDQLDRLKPTSFGSKEYSTEELKAEMTAALVSQRYGMTKHLKEDSAAYLKGWLESLKEEPTFIKTILTDVKKASQMITQKVDAIQLQLNKGVDEGKSESQPEQPKLKNLGTFDHPYLNGVMPQLPYPLELCSAGVWHSTEEKIHVLKDLGFHDFDYCQTLLKNPMYTNEDAEDAVPGYQSGGYVAIIARK